MAPLYRIPRRFYPLYEAGRLAARQERLNNPDRRTQLLGEAAHRRKERDHALKIARTRRIAREWTAQRKAATSSHSSVAA